MQKCFITSLRGLARILICLAISVPAMAQVTMVINKLPDSTPASDTLFLAGSFNDWKPNDKNYILHHQQDGTYAITLPRSISEFQYKITRGSWPSVEGDINGNKIEDRSLRAPLDKPTTVYLQILSWEDMQLYHSWDIVVDHVPDNTPFDAQIFVSGSFNNWKENESQYKLIKLPNGTYGIKIPKQKRDTIWFKFHRGNWAAVESRANGRPQNNRLTPWDKSHPSTSIVCNIEAWEDIGGNVNLVFSFFLIACAIQAVVLVFSLMAIRRKQREVSVALVAVLLVTAVTLLARLATYDRAIFDWQPKLLLVADLSDFLYGSLFFLLFTTIAGTTLPWKPAIVRIILIGLPMAQLAAYIPALVMPRSSFIQDSIDGKFNTLFNTVAVSATVYNTLILVACFYLLAQQRKTIKNYGYQLSYSYLITIITHASILLCLWIVSHALYMLAPVFQYNGRLAHEYTIDVIWIIFGLSTYVHTFLVIRKPELFKLKEEEDKQRSPFQKENLTALKTSLETIIKKQKPYLNSKLGLQDLAELMTTNIHTLSWIINEGYGKNFFDFINEYRIEEFKRLVSSEQHKNHTFLSIAMESGFSSKATFNRAFKKCTGKTPREYFNGVQESQLADIGD